MFENLNSTNIQITKYEETIHIRANTYLVSAGIEIYLNTLDKETDINKYIAHEIGYLLEDIERVERKRNSAIYIDLNNGDVKTKEEAIKQCQKS